MAFEEFVQVSSSLRTEQNGVSALVKASFMQLDDPMYFLQFFLEYA